MSVSPGSLAELLFPVFSNSPDRLALWVNDRTYTYQKLGLLAQSIVSQIKGSEGPVAIFSDRNETAYAAILAAIFSGRAYIPLNPKFPIERTMGMIKDSRASVVVCDERCSKLLSGHDLNILVPDFAKASAPLAQPVSVNAEDVVYVIFTSGTTGRPKGVPITHRNLLTYLKNFSKLLEPTSSDRLTQSSEFTFDFSVHEIFLAWTSGASLYSVPEGMATMIERFIRSFEITVMAAVPSSAAIIRAGGRLRENSLPSLRVSIFGGESFSSALASDWSKAAPNSKIINIYGPTETTVAITAFEWTPNVGSGVTPLGFPFEDVKVKIVDDQLEPVSDGTSGELIIYGPQVSSGYLSLQGEKYVRLKDSDLTWYRTADRVVYDPLVGLRYLGRLDRQLKVRGFRVECFEIEEHLRNASGSDWVAVVGSTEDALTKGLVGFVVKPKFSAEEIIAVMKKSLPSYMVPDQIFSMPELPLSSNGKIDYTALSAKAISTLTF
jgi:D-alanine--poly(phosphoribitol) ligase subunit 1